jgi:hypothetical protein
LGEGRNADPLASSRFPVELFGVGALQEKAA